MIFNLGSINADHVYSLPDLPSPGATLAAQGYRRMLGGKGANQSIAVARSGAKVRHLGCVGADGGWMLDRMRQAGVDIDGIVSLEGSSGHAIVMVAPTGENAIVIHPGANRAIPPAVLTPLDSGAPRDWLLLQNETAQQVAAARRARAQGMSVAYSAAPFDIETLRAVLPHTGLLIINAGEAQALCAALECDTGQVPVPRMVVTKGADGAEWMDRDTGATLHAPAFDVPVTDTTGAGDTFAGYLVAGLAQGLDPGDAMRRASAAAALQVQRPGAAAAIPGVAAVRRFLAQEPPAKGAS